MITEYFADFDAKINETDFIISSRIEKRKINNFLGIIEGTVILEIGILEIGILDILEVVKVIDNQFFKKKYKYNFRKKNNSLIFRYDNAPHHPSIENFPHHKHLLDKIIACNEPNLLQVFSEIKEIIS